MQLSKALLAMISINIVLAHPVLMERDSLGHSVMARSHNNKIDSESHKVPNWHARDFDDDDDVLFARATTKKPASKKSTPKNPPVEQVTSVGGDFESQMRAKNAAPDRKIPDRCKVLTDCHCPTRNVACINGSCSCDNKVLKGLSNQIMTAVSKIGNSAVVKAIGNLMAGISDVKEVASIVAGAVLGPEAKAALKVALNVVPDTGPSHIDQASKNVLKKLT